jgi:uncharacterized protein (DUF1501 family)
MQRRDFIKRTLAAGTIVPLATTGLVARPLAHNFFRAAAVSDRILVLVNLNGGNDGTNTVVPFNDPIYYQSRPSIALDKSQTLQITDDLGLHNAMTKFRDRFENEQLAIVQSVGYPNQNRSHFRSTDIWNTASDSEVILGTGWLGRALELEYPDYPQVLPKAPFAVQISSSLSLALQSSQGNMGLAIDNPDRFYNLANGLDVEPEPLPDTLAGPELKYVRDIIEQSNAFSSAINKAMLDGTTNVTYDSDSLSNQLRVVARLINSGIETGIYVVSLGGFDTHRGQAGAHTTLLSYVSNAISTFLDDIAASDNADRVVCMTYSEFGRRLNENGSNGTDHGSASPQFVVGKPVKGGVVLGGVPNLTDLDNRGDIEYVNDFRQIYAAVLEDWFRMSHADTTATLGGEFEKLPLFEPASPTRAPMEASLAGMSLAQNVPNPAVGRTTVTFSIPSRMRVLLSITSTEGRTLASYIDRTLDAGTHQIDLDVSMLPTGNYLYSLQGRGYKVTKKMMIVR